jgi:hypothetical protein
MFIKKIKSMIGFRNIRVLFVLVLFFSFMGLGVAQSDSGKRITKPKSAVKPQIEEPEQDTILSAIDSLENLVAKQSSVNLVGAGMSNVAYQGRNYGVLQKGLMAGVNLKLKNGLSFSVGGNFWSEASPNRYAETDLGVDYGLELSKTMSLTLGYERWISTNPPTVGGKATSTNYTTLGLSLDAGVVNLATNFYYTYTVGVSGGGASFVLSKAFEIEDIFGLDKIKINPAFFAEFGVGNIDRPVTSSGKGGKGVTSIVSSLGGRIVNYQFDLPVIYRKIGKYEFGPTLHYAVPQNTTSAEGSLTPFIYFTVDLMVNLARW